MNKKEAKEKIRELLSAGQAKAEVFKSLSGQGLKDSRLAYLIASHADSARRSENKRKVDILVVLMLIYSIFGLLLGWELGAQFGVTEAWIFAAVTVSVPLLLTWGFRGYKLWAYNIFILLSFIELPKTFSRPEEITLDVLFGFGVSVALLLYVISLRTKLFPGLLILSARKVNGEYVFTS